MSRGRGREGDDQKRLQRKEQRRAPVTQHDHKTTVVARTTTSPNEVTYPASLLDGSRLNGRSNEPVRIAVMQQVQQTQGNRALQRVLQRSTAGRSVQRDVTEGITEAAGGAATGAVADPDSGNPSAPAKAGSSSHPTVKMGSKGVAVEELQQKLNKDIEKNGGKTLLVVDGIFGPLTRQAVVSFQKRNNLAADGIVGPLTWGKIDELGLGSDVGRVEKEWTEVVGGVTYGMTSRYTWRILDSEIRITVKLRFTGLDRPALVEQWFNAIRGTWNRFDAVNEKGEKLAVTFDPQSVTSGEDNAVEIKAGNGRSNAAEWYSEDPDSDQTASHEFGHMVGLEDEYQRGHTDYKRLTGVDPDKGPANAGNAPTISTEMHTALAVADEPTRIQQANDVITKHNLVQGEFSQKVAAAYQASYGINIVDEIVAKIPEADQWSIVDPFTHSGQSIMGLGGNHDHPIEARHVRDFIGYISASKPGSWKAVER